MTKPTHLTLLVPNVPEQPAAEEDFEEHAIRDHLPFRLFGRPKEVDLGKLQADLKRVQGQIDELLAAVDRSEKSGFRLGSIEVSLALSAEGSIGVVTAGVEAGIALTFERAGA